MLVRAALPRSHQRERVRRPRGRALLDGPAARPAIPVVSTSTSAASSTRCCTCCTRASGTRCCSTSATCRRSSRTAACSTRATSSRRLQGSTWHLRRGRRRSKSATASYFHGEAEVTARDGEDGQEPEERASRPTTSTAQYGADTLRLYEMFMGPLDQVAPLGDHATSSACTASCSGCGAT